MSNPARLSRLSATVKEGLVSTLKTLVKMKKNSYFIKNDMRNFFYFKLKHIAIRLHFI